jgi:hypothetical protein
VKLFMVIYIVGKIGGTVGPLPYGIDECEIRAADMLAGLDKTVVTPEGHRASDVEFKCEWHAQRPGNDYK